MAGKGLQDANIALQYIPAALSAAVLIVRIWKKQRDRCLGGGELPL